MEEELGQKVHFLPGKQIQKVDDIKLGIEIIQSTIGYQSFIKNEFSPINKLFSGLEHASTKCQICGHESNNFQTFKVWELPIPLNSDPSQVFDIKDCMDKWSELEKLDDDNRLRCDFCNIKSNAQKKSLIAKNPKILIIQLKRFKKDMFGNISRKIKNKINFPIENLDISDYTTKCNKDSSKYNLFGVNLHYELGGFANINIGHYVSIVKNRFDSKWYTFNDSHTVTPILNKEQINDPNSYNLFYYRIN